MDNSFNVGDLIKVHQKIVEKEKVKGAGKREEKEEQKERIQIFEGVVLGKKGVGENATFTVRRISAGKIGVERIWPVNSPSIAKIEVVKNGDIKRAKLYYLRGRDMKQIFKNA